MDDKLFINEVYVTYNNYVYHSQIPYKYSLVIYKNYDIILYNYTYILDDNGDDINDIKILFQISDNIKISNKNLYQLIDIIKSLYIRIDIENALTNYEDNLYYLCNLVKKIKLCNIDLFKYKKNIKTLENKLNELIINNENLYKDLTDNKNILVNFNKEEIDIKLKNKDDEIILLNEILKDKDNINSILNIKLKDINTILNTKLKDKDNEICKLNNSLKSKNDKIIELSNHKISNSEQQLRCRINKFIVENNDLKLKIKNNDLDLKNINKKSIEINKSNDNLVIFLKTIFGIQFIFIIYILYFLFYLK